MKKLRRFICLATALFSVGLLFNGCVAAAAGAGGYGTYRYIKGEYVILVEHDFDTVWACANQAMNDLKFDINEQRVDGLQGELKAKRYNNEPVVVRVKRLANKRCEVGVRVGVIGDQDKAINVYQQIQSHFPKVELPAAR